MHLRIRLAASTLAPRQARLAIGDLLARADRPDLQDNALLIVDELVTNVVLHAPGPIILRAVYADGHLRVEVQDSNPTLPVLRPPSGRAESGRGIFLVEHLATTWGSTPNEDGKATWFEVS